jgi:hypothetical protein
MSKHRLSKAALTERLRAWHAGGVSVERLWRQDPVVTSRASALFGSWRAALEAAGFQSVREQWSGERVLSELKLRRGIVKSHDHKLRAAAVRYYGSLRQALTAAGLPTKPRLVTRSWTNESVIKGIQLRVSQGRGLKATGREDPALYAAAKRLFGSWRAACAAAGHRAKERKTFTPPEVLSRIALLHQSGASLSGVREREAALYRAATKYFGTWHRAVLEAKIPTKVPRRWSRQRVIQAIAGRQAAGRVLCRTWREDKALFRAAVTWFGSWESAMRAAGFEPIRRERWSQQRVIERLQVWRRRTRETNLSTSEPNLASAATRLFGSLEAACQAADIEATPRRWTVERVIAEIQERYVRGEPRHIQGLGDIRLALAAKRHFGSWASAVAAAGLEQRIPITRPQRRWNRQLVIDSIMSAHRSGTALSEIRRCDQGLYYAARTHFGSWRAAVREAGLSTTHQQWTRALIVQQIVERHQRRASLSSGRRENINLAAAAYRYFGSWTAALVAAGVMAKPTQRRLTS